jgi:pilus assembly protein CpaC
MRQIRPTQPGRGTLTAAARIFIIAVFGSSVVFAQNAPGTAQAVATTASLEAPVAVDTAASAPAADSVRILVGRSTLIDVGSAIARVSLTSADVADALVTSPNQLLVHGKVPGAISMFVWGRSGGVKRYEIAVQRDLTRLTEQLTQLFPNEKVTVQSNGRSVILSGTVSSKDALDRIVNVANSSVEKKEDVTSVLQVREARQSNQVLLKVRFAEVSRSAMTEFGVSFFTSPTGIKNTIGRTSTQQFAAPDFSDLAWSKANGDFGSDVTSASGKVTFSDFLNLFLLNEKYDLGMVLKAMQQRGLFQSLAEPNLVSESGKEASFLAGGEFPVPVVQGLGAQQSISIQFKEFGIRLNFTPTVNGERVHLKVRPEVSSLDYGNAVVLNGFRIPALQTRRTETELELRDGQTFAVAGLMNNQVASTMQKIPGIGDIPVLGQLFRSRAAKKDQTELVVMITPHILSTESNGVTGALPRTPEAFLPALSERRTQPVLPPAFGSGRQSSISEGAAAEAATGQRLAADKARIETERDAAKQDAAAARRQPDDFADRQAEADKVDRDERKRQEKAAKAMAKAEAEAAEEAAEAAKHAAGVQRESEKLAAKAAEKARKEAEKQAEADRKAEEKRTKEQQKADEAALSPERQRAVTSAEARLREAQAAYQEQSKTAK